MALRPDELHDHARPRAPSVARQAVGADFTADGRFRVQRSVIVLLSVTVGLLAVMVVVGIWSLVYLGDIHALVQLVRAALDTFGRGGF